MDVYEAAIRSSRHRAVARQGSLQVVAQLVDHSIICYRLESGRWLQLPGTPPLDWQPLPEGALDDEYVRSVLGIEVRPRLCRRPLAC